MTAERLSSCLCFQRMSELLENSDAARYGLGLKPPTENKAVKPKINFRLVHKSRFSSEN